MLVPGASNSAENIDKTFYYIFGISLVLLTLVTAAMVIFVIRYNKKRNPRPENVEGSLFLEIIWTVIPTVLVLIMFYVGWRSFVHIRQAPENALPIQVTAQQWSWQFRYENGKLSDVLRVPVGKPVRLILSSRDVLHCLYIPAFRIKEDCVPGMSTYLWFTAKEIGTYEIFCTEYCGLGHSGMLSKVLVTSESDFAAWYKGRVGAPSVDRGLKLLEEKGCLGCHTTDGSAKVGPTLRGVMGRRETVLTAGKERVITVDEAYVRRSILEPQADIVKGYAPIMPALPVTNDEVTAIVAYLMELK